MNVDIWRLFSTSTTTYYYYNNNYRTVVRLRLRLATYDYDDDDDTPTTTTKNLQFSLQKNFGCLSYLAQQTHEFHFLKNLIKMLYFGAKNPQK